MIIIIIKIILSYFLHKCSRIHIKKLKMQSYSNYLHLKGCMRTHFSPFDPNKSTAQQYLFFIFFFLGESSSEPFLPLPLEPRFSLTARDSLSVENINMKRTWRMHISLFCNFLLVKCFKYPTHSSLFPLYFRSRSLPVSLLARSQSGQDLHLVYGYVCPPAVWRISILIKTRRVNSLN